MKKILQVCAIDLSVDLLLKPLIRSSQEKGYIVHNACTDTGRFDRLRQEGLNMIDIPIERKISPISNFKSVYQLYKLMKHEKYDIVHVHTPVAAIVGRIAAKLAGVKHIVYTAHGFYFHDDMAKRDYRFFFLVEKYFAKFLTDWLLLVSKEDYELCVAKKFKHSSRIIHISNGVDILKRFQPKRIDDGAKACFAQEFHLSNEDVVFTFIGRFVREKGIFELLEAFQRLKNIRSNVKLLMIGDVLHSERDQQSYVKLKEYLSDEEVIAPGFREDIPELLSISDVFVLPSYREGLPRSIMEAMAMEKPIIATNIRGCREEVFDGENGFLVTKGSSDELYEKMLFLTDNKGKREVFGRRSRSIVEENFNEEKLIRKQLLLFSGLG